MIFVGKRNLTKNNTGIRLSQGEKDNELHVQYVDFNSQNNGYNYIILSNRNDIIYQIKYHESLGYLLNIFPPQQGILLSRFCDLLLIEQ